MPNTIQKQIADMLEGQGTDTGDLSPMCQNSDFFEKGSKFEFWTVDCKELV